MNFMASIYEPEVGHCAIGHLGSIREVMELARHNGTKIWRLKAPFDA